MKLKMLTKKSIQKYLNKNFQMVEMKMKIQMNQNQFQKGKR